MEFLRFSKMLCEVKTVWKITLINIILINFIYYYITYLGNHEKIITLLDLSQPVFAITRVRWVFYPMESVSFT